MSADSDREIKLQFLEEAQDYLDTIEAGLLGLGTGNLSGAKLDGVLRAAHSIKGGAAMMSFGQLSEIAHRLEDFFKVLKTGTATVDGELERLMLLSMDVLRQIVAWHRGGVEQIDPDWITTSVNPILDQLHERLGDPQPEDAAAMLAAEMGEDMSVLVFQTEVEETLTQLESLLDDPGEADLTEELINTATEMLGLGEMLEISAFSSLCQSIIEQLTSLPDQINEIAAAALQSWRRSQALILVGQTNVLPTSLTLGEDTSPNTLEAVKVEDISSLLDPEVDYDIQAEDLFSAIDEASTAKDLFSAVEENKDAQDLFSSIDEAVETSPIVKKAIPHVSESATASVAPPRIETSTPETSVAKDTTIRVSLPQLEQISDLFGELTIERNSIDTQLKNLRYLFGLLTQRIKSLEQANVRLRNNYDQVATLDRAAKGAAANRATAAAFSNTPILNHTFKAVETDLALSSFDSLEMDQYSDLHLLSQEIMETIVQIQEVSKDIEINLEDSDRSTKDLNRTTKQMQASINHLRMRPIADLVNRFPRALRNMELKYGKKVELKIKGGSTLVDRTILEALNDPLMHLLRNAFDHGIEPPQARIRAGKPETGTITISAYYRGNQTIITIADDGKGINLEKIRDRVIEMGLDLEDLNHASDRDLLNLIFEPGFSTAERVTDLSGRGVGMDVVRTNLNEINGDINVDTKLGQGTTFTINVPFTLSVVKILLVESNGMLLAFPSNAVEEMIPFQRDQILQSAGQEVFNWEGVMVCLIRLNQFLQLARTVTSTDNDDVPTINQPTILMVAHGEDLIGITVDRYWREEEVTIRQVEGDIKMPSAFTGCTILGDGRVVPLVDVINLLESINNTQKGKAHFNLDVTTSKPEPNLASQTKSTIMIVDDSITVRRFLAHTLEKANYRVEQAKDGQDAVDQLQTGIDIQAVICDIEMPRLDGYGFLAKIRSLPKYQKTPVAMLTSRSGSKHRQLAMNLGANAYFSKPFQEKQLLQTLEQLINR